MCASPRAKAGGGLTGSPDESGSRRREKGLARAGNARCLDGIDPSVFRPTKFFDGRNWEAAQADRCSADRLFRFRASILTHWAEGSPRMSEINEDDPFAMANLPPHVTGLPMVVWASQRMGLPHDLRIKVMQTHGPRRIPATSPSLLCARRRGSLPGICRQPICGQSGTGSGSTKPC